MVSDKRTFLKSGLKNPKTCTVITSGLHMNRRPRWQSPGTKAKETEAAVKVCWHHSAMASNVRTHISRGSHTSYWGVWIKTDNTKHSGGDWHLSHRTNNNKTKPKSSDLKNIIWDKKSVWYLNILIVSPALSSKLPTKPQCRTTGFLCIL